MNLENAIPVSSGDNVQLSVLGCGVALVKIDCKDNLKVNLLSSAVMAELDEVTKTLEGAICNRHLPPLHGVVFYSGKFDSFIAGADIKEIVKAQSMPVADVYKACQKGKDVLERIARLPMRTVCAVHGRCLGGGMETFLRFDYRLASDCPKTVFGLPEVGLGVIPGWGGCVILPRMAGHSAAVSLILNPLKPWSARKAHANGVVSEVVAKEKLLDRAVELARGGRELADQSSGVLSRLMRRIGDSAIGRCLTATMARCVVKVMLGGAAKNPAPYAALEVMDQAFRLPLDEALSLESAQFAMLSQTEGCKRGVQRFLDYQAKRKQK